jgi:hypothetical protein
MWGLLAMATDPGAARAASSTPTVDIEEDEDGQTPSRILFSTTDVTIVSAFVSTGFKYALFGRLDGSGPVVLGTYAAGISPQQGFALIPQYGSTSITQGRTLLGWQIRSGETIAALYGGFSSDDRTRIVPQGIRRAAFWGPAVHFELWSNVTPHYAVSLSASFNGADGYSWGRISVAARLYGSIFLGPEVSGNTNGDYTQTRIGLRLTGLKFGPFGIEASGGGFVDTDRHRGPYGTLTLVATMF